MRKQTNPYYNETLSIFKETGVLVHMVYKTGFCHFCQSDSFIQLTQIMMTNFSGSYQNLFKTRSNAGKFHAENISFYFGLNESL